MSIDADRLSYLARRWHHHVKPFHESYLYSFRNTIAHLMPRLAIALMNRITSLVATLPPTPLAALMYGEGHRCFPTRWCIGHSWSRTGTNAEAASARTYRSHYRGGRAISSIPKQQKLLALTGADIIVYLCVFMGFRVDDASSAL